MGYQRWSLQWRPDEQSQVGNKLSLCACLVQQMAPHCSACVHTGRAVTLQAVLFAPLITSIYGVRLCLAQDFQYRNMAGFEGIKELSIQGGEHGLWRVSPKHWGPYGSDVGLILEKVQSDQDYAVLEVPLHIVPAPAQLVQAGGFVACSHVAMHGL